MGRVSWVALIFGALVLVVGVVSGVHWSDVGHTFVKIRWFVWCLVVGVLLISGVLMRSTWASYRKASDASWGLTAVLIIVPVVVLTALSLTILRLTVHVSDSSNQIDLIKTALTVGAGTGGIAALVLSGRRQWATERAHRDIVIDATARRITDLYAKASEQLGSDKAPVRLAGLYALERLADENEEQRQTIVNVFCAYLRMPFTRPQVYDLSEAPFASMEAVDLEPAFQEQEVRNAAQQILSDHLRSGNELTSFWSDIDIDLTGAVLVGLDLSDCCIRSARFDRADLYITSTFANAEFERAVFMRTKFRSLAQFASVKFHGVVAFGGAEFYAPATFTRTQFLGVGDFREAVFYSKVDFRYSHFGEMSLDDAWVKEGDPQSPLSRHEWPRGYRVVETGEKPSNSSGSWGKVYQTR